MDSEEKKDKAEQAKSKATVTERQRFKGKMNKTENKARAATVKARRRKQGHEAVSDQKSHEYH